MWPRAASRLPMVETVLPASSSWRTTRFFASATKMPSSAMLMAVFFEEARWAYWMEVVGQGLEELDYVLAECRVRWHARVLWPQTLRVGVRVVRVGRKQFEMEYEGQGDDATRLQSGTTVQVLYEYDAQASKRLSDTLRDTLEGFDGPFS